MSSVALLDDSKKPFADLSNTSSPNFNSKVVEEGSSPEVVVLSSKKNKVKLDNMPNESNHLSNGIKKFEEQKDLIQPVLMKKLLDKIHHSGSAFEVERIADDLREVLKQFHPEENVLFELDGETKTGQIVSVERKGGAKFYVIKYKEEQLPNKINGNLISREYDPTDEDLKLFIESVSVKVAGKPWEVTESLRKEYNIVNKLASLFCATPKARNLASKSEESEEDEDVPLENLRRSGTGLPPSSVKKNFVKKQKEIEKVKEKEEKKKARKSETDAAKAAKKAEEKEKKQQEKEVKKEQKKQEKERMKLEKNEKKMEEKKQKEEKSLLDTPSIKDAFANQSGNPTPSSENGSPLKSMEKRLISFSNRLLDLWVKKDQKAFTELCIRAARSLSAVTIDKIGHELIKFSVKKQFDIKKDAEAMKGMSRQWKANFKLKMKDSRKTLYNSMEPRVRSHFKSNVDDIVEDLTVSKGALACIGEKIVISADRREFYIDCLMITQFLGIQRSFFDTDSKFTAADLLDSIFDGKKGYLKVTSKVLIILLNTLVHSDEYKNICHFNHRIGDLVFEENTVSELLRAFLIGYCETATEIDIKIEKAEKRLKKEEDPNSEKIIEEVEKKIENETEEDEDSGRDSPDSQLEVSQLDIEELEDIKTFFGPDKEFWMLSPQQQMVVIKYVFHKVLDMYSFKDFMLNTANEKCNSIKTKITAVKEQLETLQESLKKLPEIDENIDELSLTRSQAKERVEQIRKRKDLEKKIVDAQEKFEVLENSYQRELTFSFNIKRIQPIGQDRHLRFYYLFPMLNTDSGIWIQTFNESSYEKLYASSASTKNTPTKGSPTKGSPMKNGSKTSIKELPKSDASNQIGLPDSSSEVWYKVKNFESINKLINNLSDVGTRERNLKKALNSNLESISGCYNIAVSENPNTEEEIECGETLDLVRNDAIQLAKDLCDSYLSNLDLDSFEARIVSALKIDDFKPLFVELIDSITSTAIIVHFGRDRFLLGIFTFFKVERWKRRVQEVQNASALIILLKLLDSRIDWKKSITEKQCSVCGSKRFPEGKIPCSVCSKVFHYYCTRPKLQEKPPTYTCPSCSEPKKKAAKKPVYREADSDEDEENTENEQNSDFTDEGDDDDYFSRENQTRGSKRKHRSDFGIEDDDDYGRRTKRSKVNPITEQCTALINEIKSDSRMYKRLQYVQVSRSSRQNKKMNLESIEKTIHNYDTFQKFKSDLIIFFDAARAYFEEHNERNLADLENMIIELNLTK